MSLQRFRRELPSQEYLQSRIEYNPETGEARWKPVDESYGPSWKQFNAKHCNQLIRNKYIHIDFKNQITAKILYKLHYGVEPPARLAYLDKNNLNFAITNITPKAKTLLKDVSFLPRVNPLPIDVDSILAYNHITGVLTWKPRDEPRSFNAQYAGRDAGYISQSGYMHVKTRNTIYLHHRLAWMLYYGVDPGKYLIDHIDRNPSNNPINNLRLATNSMNQQVANLDAKGYVIRPKDGRYQVAIKVNSQQIHLGVYATEEEATAAYEAAVQKLKPIYKFTESEQTLLDNLYNTYPNCSLDLQHACHELQVKALNYYIDAAIVQTPNLEYNSSS